MASSIPEQIRTVDPYSSYNSNVVNQLTGIVTRGSNSLDICNSLQVISDSTSANDHVEVLPGIIYKDDMLIEITSSLKLDFTDPQHYVSASGDPFNTEEGYYYVVIEYSYVKSRPAPKAYLKILLPSQTASYRAGAFTSLFFLKAVEVEVNAGQGEIVALYDYDPDYTETKRIYVHNHASTEVFLPTFEAARDQSRIAYVTTEDKYYLGYSTQWREIGASSGGSSFIANTTGFEIGDLVYVTSLGNLSKAVGPYDISTADGVVTSVGTAGTVQVSGSVTDVKMETGIIPSVGDILYLSETEAGTVTNVKPSPTWQFVGRCSALADSTSTTEIEVLFVRGEPNGYGVTGITTYGTLSSGNWLDSTSTTNVYQDIDVSAFDDGIVVPSFWITSDGYKIQPEDFLYLDTTTVRVYMPNGFAEDIDYLLVGPPNLP